MRRVLRILLLLALVPVLYVASAALYFPAVVWHRFHPPRETALMELRERQAAAEGRPWSPRYQWVPLGSIAPDLARAVLAAEDTRFYDHRGFDLEQIRRAWRDRGRGRTLRGASTITQQTVKNLYLSPSRNVLRKLREALLTVWMEVWLPKDRILELYLNVVELGPGVFGAEAAARTYFDRSAARLTCEQAALLAATLPAPLARNPGAPTPGLRRRQRLVLGRMNRWFGGDRSPAAPVEAGDRPVERPAPDRRSAEPLELPADQGPPDPIAADTVPAPSASEPPAPAAPVDSFASGAR